MKATRSRIGGVARSVATHSFAKGSSVGFAPTSTAQRHVQTLIDSSSRQIIQQVACSVVQRQYNASSKELQTAAKKTGQGNDDLRLLAQWVSDKSMWLAFTADKNAFTTWSNILVHATADDLKNWKQKEEIGDWVQAAAVYLQFEAAKAKSSAPPRRQAQEVSLRTLSEVERHWNSGDHSHFSGLEPGTGLSTTSKSGGGMLLLKQVIVTIDREPIMGHISLPADKKGDGTFTEGHFKIEGGDLLNQYFFTVDASGNAAKAANSPTVPTQNPGDWSKLGQDAWNTVRNLVKHLAVRPSS